MKKKPDDRFLANIALIILTVSLVLVSIINAVISIKEGVAFFDRNLITLAFIYICYLVNYILDKFKR